MRKTIGILAALVVIGGAAGLIYSKNCTSCKVELTVEKKILDISKNLKFDLLFSDDTEKSLNDLNQGKIKASFGEYFEGMDLSKYPEIKQSLPFGKCSFGLYQKIEVKDNKVEAKADTKDHKVEAKADKKDHKAEVKADKKDHKVEAKADTKDHKVEAKTEMIIGYYHESLLTSLKKKYGNDVKFVKYASTNALIKDVNNGKINAACVSDLVLKNIQKGFEFKAIEELGTKNLIVLFGKDSKIDINAFNQHLTEKKEDKKDESKDPKKVK